MSPPDAEMMFTTPAGASQEESAGGCAMTADEQQCWLCTGVRRHLRVWAVARGCPQGHVALSWECDSCIAWREGLFLQCACGEPFAEVLASRHPGEYYLPAGEEGMWVLADIDLKSLSIRYLTWWTIDDTSCS